ncbi:hypothetical protein QCD58_004930 [Enterobacter hormaechei]|nr:hypothetical protein [Enterobacter hormaechei]
MNSEWKELCEIMNAYIKTQVLSTACDLKIFDAINSGATVNSIAQRLMISDQGARVLLMGLKFLKLVIVEDNGVLKNTSLADKYLTSASLNNMLDFVSLNDKIQHRACLHFTDALLQSKNSGINEFDGKGDTLYERLTFSPELERVFHLGMGAYTKSSPQIMHTKDYLKISKLLDVGGGDATNAIRLCNKFPHLNVIVIDIPSVIEKAKRNVDINNLSDRITCLELDVFTSKWPDGCDGVLFSHFLEIFSPEKIQFLYKKAFDYLNGGYVFVWSLMCEPGDIGNIQSIKSSLYFLTVASGEGMTYPPSEHKCWLKGVGFSIVDEVYVQDIEHCSIVASNK